MVADANQDKTSELGWLDELLVDKSPEFQAKVLRWTVRMNIKPKEPLFLTLVAIGQLQALLEDSPKDLSSLFDQWSEQLYDNLKEAERVAVKGQQTAISSAVATLLRKTQWEQATKLSAILPAAGLLTVAIGFGTLIGLGVSAWLQSQVNKDPTGSRQLTLEQAEYLRWAESKEGKFARNLMHWNAGSLDNLDCKNDVKSGNKLCWTDIVCNSFRYAKASSGSSGFRPFQRLGLNFLDECVPPISIRICSTYRISKLERASGSRCKTESCGGCRNS